MNEDEFNQLETVHVPTQSEFESLQSVSQPSNAIAPNVAQMMRLDPLTALGYQNAEKISPRFSESGSAFGLLLDLETLPGRAVSAGLGALRGEGFDLGKTESSPFGAEGRWQDVFRTPGLLASSLTAGAAAPYAAGLRTASPLLAGAVEFGAPALTGATFTQAENIAMDRPWSGKQFLTESVVGAGIGKGMQLAGSKVLPKVQEAAEDFAAKYGGVSNRILELYGGKGLLKSLKGTVSSKWANTPAKAGSPAAKLEMVQKMAGEIQPLAEDFARLVDEIPKRVADDIKIRDAALAEAEDINISPIINEIVALRKKSPSGKLSDKWQAYNDEVDNILSDLTGKIKGVKGAAKTKYSAVDVLTLREMLSPKTDFNSLPGAKNEINSLYNRVYGLLRGKLLESADKGGPQYREAMQEAAKKLDLRDRLYQYIGNSNLTAEERSGKFLQSLTHGDKFARRKFIEDIDKTFGKGFAEKIDLYGLSKELDGTGSLPWFTKVATGAGNTPWLISKGLQALSMPKVAAPALAGTRPLLTRMAPMAADALSVPASRIAAQQAGRMGMLYGEEQR